jgi:hypothetical protein
MYILVSINKQINIYIVCKQTHIPYWRRFCVFYLNDRCIECRRYAGCTMYIRIYVYVYICIHIDVYIQTYIRIHVYNRHIYIHMYTYYIYIYICIYVYICIYRCIYMYIYLPVVPCTRIYVCIYTFLHMCRHKHMQCTYACAIYACYVRERCIYIPYVCYFIFVCRLRGVSSQHVQEYTRGYCMTLSVVYATHTSVWLNLCICVHVNIYIRMTTQSCPVCCFIEATGTTPTTSLVTSGQIVRNTYMFR